MTSTLPMTTVMTGDGSRLAVYDFGGNGPALLLAHATGFHAGVLRVLAAELSGRWHCYGFDFRAHGQSVAAGSWAGDWETFGDDVLAVVDALGLERAVGFGHSCGGASLLMAEESRAGTFAQLYCFEPVVTPLDEPPPPTWEIPIAQAALRRREVFGSRSEALVNYSAKPPLSALAPAVLADYVEYGFEDLPDGSVRLRCRGADEAKIYAHGISHHAYGKLGLVECPVTLAHGAETDAYGQPVLDQVAGRLARCRTESFAGLGHLGPLSHPAAVAASIIRGFDTPPT